MSFRFETKGHERTAGPKRKSVIADVKVHICDDSDTEFLRQASIANEAVVLYRDRGKAEGPFFCADKPELFTIKG